MNKGFKIAYVIEDNGCWVCVSHKGRSNYPQKYINGKMVNISRYMYEKHISKIPDNLFVLHTCDNTWCINPKHLKLGNHQDNMDDKVEKGRQYKGETIWQSKLKESDVIEIYKSNDRPVELAKRYNISACVVSNIKANRRWRWLTKTL